MYLIATKYSMILLLNPIKILFNNFTVLWKESPYNIVFICRDFPFRNQYDVAAWVSNMAGGQQKIFHSCFCAESLKSDSVMAKGGLHRF